MHLLKFMNTPKVCCQIIRKLHHFIVFIYLVSKNASICFVFAVCVLLFSYELHRRIGLMDKANNHVSVMYASLHNVRQFFSSQEAKQSYHTLVTLFLILYLRAVDPGVVKTNIMREIPPFLSNLAFALFQFLGLLHSPDEGAKPIIDAALAPPVSFSLLISAVFSFSCWFDIIVRSM